ncbi:MAG: type VI secretion system baseplate subunit TssE [Planctomycetota bacterium]|jgi:type VI secretion system protein ImpF
MAELAPMDRLQPCLLDRLTDDEPEGTKESRDRRVVSVQKYRTAVLRDVEMVFNSRSRPSEDYIYEFAEAARSVLNYGVPDLCGATISGITPADIESRIKHALGCFEPRISRESLSVRIVSAQDTRSAVTISFEIEGELWAQPSPEHLLIKTEVDLETGHCEWKGESSG